MTPAPQDRDARPSVAVIGCGYWGRNLVRNFAELGALAAVVDADAVTAQGLADKHGARVMPLDAVLADPAIRAIAIAAPAVLHVRLARLGLEAGKDVFVEKPVALDVNEAEALCQLAARLDRRLMVGHLLQYHPVFIRLRELVREGRLGRIQHIFFGLHIVGFHGIIGEGGHFDSGTGRCELGPGGRRSDQPSSLIIVTDQPILMMKIRDKHVSA